MNISNSIISMNKLGLINQSQLSNSKITKEINEMLPKLNSPHPYKGHSLDIKG